MKIIRLLILNILYSLNIKSNPKFDRTIRIKGKKIFVGKYSYGYENMKILSWGETSTLHIGRFCSIASGLKIFLGGNHHFEYVSSYPFGGIFSNLLHIPEQKNIVYSKGDIVIGNDVWIGRDVTIMSGVNIGDGAVIAANSHVISDIESYAVYGGNPAQLIKYRFTHEVIKSLLEIRWWSMEDSQIEKIFPLLLTNPNETIITKLKKSF